MKKLLALAILLAALVATAQAYSAQIYSRGNWESQTQYRYQQMYGSNTYIVPQVSYESQFCVANLSRQPIVESLPKNDSAWTCH